MKGLLELQAENDAAVARAEAKRTASLRRLKQRIANLIHPITLSTSPLRRDINAAIDAWDAAERKRGAR
jgi:hypothetical protein